jgi:hypothetical protein
MYLSCGTNCNELSLQSKRFLLGISNIANGQNINTVVSKLNDQLTKQNELLRKQYLATIFEIPSRNRFDCKDNSLQFVPHDKYIIVSNNNNSIIVHNLYLILNVNTYLI